MKGIFITIVSFPQAKPWSRITMIIIIINPYLRTDLSLYPPKSRRTIAEIANLTRIAHPVVFWKCSVQSSSSSKVRPSQKSQSHPKTPRHKSPNSPPTKWTQLILPKSKHLQKEEEEPNFCKFSCDSWVNILPLKTVWIFCFVLIQFYGWSQWGRWSGKWQRQWQW